MFFDYNYLVVGSTHAKSACDHVPEHWGIISVEYLEDRVDIYKLRDASKNPNLDMLKKVRLLWRPEIAHIQSVCGLPAYKGKSKDFVRQVIVERIKEYAGEEFSLEDFIAHDSFAVGTKSTSVEFDWTFGVDPLWNKGPEGGSVIYMGDHPNIK